MACTSPVKLGYPGYIAQIGNGKPFVSYPKWLERYPLGFMEVPCGKCLACRIHRAQEWALRLTHELSFWDSAIFLTLTFDDQHLPADFSVSPRDLQLFFKRLRKELSKDKRKIKFFACGEYGLDKWRPHYHAIVFGLSLKEHVIVRGKVLSGPALRAWDQGFVHAGTVTHDSAAYVAKYLTKATLQDHQFWRQHFMVQPFQLCSNGLGLRWAEQDAQRLRANLHTTIKGNPCGIPRYYKQKLDIKSEDYDHIRHRRFSDSVDYHCRHGVRSIPELLNRIDAAREQRNDVNAARIRIKSAKNAGRSL